MKLRSPTEMPVYLALTSGHTFVVPTDFVEVPAALHRDAVLAGCEPERGSRSSANSRDVGSAGPPMAAACSNWPPAQRMTLGQRMSRPSAAWMEPARRPILDLALQGSTALLSTRMEAITATRCKTLRESAAYRPQRFAAVASARRQASRESPPLVDWRAC